MFRLYAITDQRLGQPDELVRLAAPGRLAVQLRDKELPADERLALARRLRPLTREHGALLIVGGGDVELARRVEADGVHLPASVPPERHEGLLVGCSCHDEAELRRAAAAGVDFATLSPVLRSPGKGRALGWTAFERLARVCRLPVFALGGLAPSDLLEARGRGAWGVAGIRGFLATLALALLLGCPGPSDDDDTTRDGDDDDSVVSGDDDDSVVSGDDDDSAPPVDVDPPASFAVDCPGAEPDDVDPTGYEVPDPPWDAATDCGPVPAQADGGLLRVHGAIQDIVVGTWDGDCDTFSFQADQPMSPSAVLRWDPLQGDLDAKVLCPRFGSWSDLYGGGLATAAVAETAEAAFEVEAGDVCWIFVVGFDGLVSEYELWLE